jgi:CopG family nickel-responsive transcriptional regulator
MSPTAFQSAAMPSSADSAPQGPVSSRRSKVSRFSVSLPADLLDRLDEMVVHRKLPNRSHAIAEMARGQLTEHARELGTTSMAGTISLVYDYRKRNLQRKLADIQHQNFLMVVTSMHVHLENYHYLEVLLVQGQPRALRALADTLAACKGVEQAHLHLTATAMPPLL